MSHRVEARLRKSYVLPESDVCWDVMCSLSLQSHHVCPFYHRRIKCAFPPFQPPHLTPSISHLIQPLRTIILRTNRQPLPFTRGPIRDLNNIHQLLLIRNLKVDLVVIPRPEIDLDVLVAPEKHDGAWVVELVHGVEVGHETGVDDVDYGVRGDEGGDFVEVFVLEEGRVSEME